MRALIIFLVLLGAAGTAQAQARRVAIAPLASLVEGGAEPTQVTTLVAAGLAAVPGITLVPDKELRAAIKKAKRKELERCERDPACLAELGKLVGAQVVIAGDVGELGSGQVAYLMSVDVAAARETGSTTAVLSGTRESRQVEARAAAFRLLRPSAYQGKLALAIDVAGATVYLDGKQVGRSPTAPIEVAVGTHALRVTHEKYRDFVRFVDVKFDDTTSLEVNLGAYPVVADRMIEHDRPLPDGPTRPRPWYRSGWFVAGGAVVVVVATAVTVAALGGGIDADRVVTIGE